MPDPEVPDLPRVYIKNGEIAVMRLVMQQPQMARQRRFLNPPFYPRSGISQCLSRRADKMRLQIDFILTKG